MQVAAVVENGHQTTIKLVDNKCRYDISCERKGKLKHDEELHTFSSFWNWVHLEILNLEKQSKKDILPCVYSCTVCMLLASRPHATQFSQLQRVNCDSLLGLWYLLPNQVDQFLLHWQKAKLILGKASWLARQAVLWWRVASFQSPRMEYFLFLLRHTLC